MELYWRFWYGTKCLGLAIVCNTSCGSYDKVECKCKLGYFPNRTVSDAS